MLERKIKFWVIFNQKVAICHLPVYVGKEDIHKYMQYDASVTVYMGRIANRRKVPKWLPSKNYKSESLNI